MKRSAWILAATAAVVAALVVGVVGVVGLADESSSTPLALARQSEGWPLEAAPPDLAAQQISEGRDRGTAPAGQDPAPAGASGPGPQLRTEAEIDAQIDEELRLTERALAASRIFSDRTAGGAQAPAPVASRETLTGASVGSTAEALGCGGAGSDCRSGAECCPGLACSGGVAGYGTVGRCESSR